MFIDFMRHSGKDILISLKDLMIFIIVNAKLTHLHICFFDDPLRNNAYRLKRGVLHIPIQSPLSFLNYALAQLT